MSLAKDDIYVVDVLCACPYQNHLVFYQVIIFRKIAIFIYSVKAHWNVAEKPLKVIYATTLVGSLQVAEKFLSLG